jgi:hypothetical protein
VSGKAAARHATGELASRDAKVLGDVLRIRFYPLAVHNTEGYIVTDVDGRQHLDFVVGGCGDEHRLRCPRGCRACDLPNFQTRWTSFGVLWFGPNEAAVGWPGLDPPNAQRFEERTWFAVCVGHGRTPRVLRLEDFGAASDAAGMCRLEGLEEATRQRTKIVDGVVDGSLS